MVQLLALYTNPESKMHSVMDRQTDRWTDGRHDNANTRPYYVAVWLAKKWLTNENNSIERRKPGERRDNVT